MRPSVVSASKSGAVLPIVRGAPPACVVITEPPGKSRGDFAGPKCTAFRLLRRHRSLRGVRELLEQLPLDGGQRVRLLPGRELRPEDPLGRGLLRDALAHPGPRLLGAGRVARLREDPALDDLREVAPR